MEGVSTRKVKEITEELCGTSFSKSLISSLAGTGSTGLQYIGPAFMIRHCSYSAFYLQMSEKQRADERTRTADLLITSDNSYVAGTCRGLQIPHFKAAFSAPASRVLHRIAFPVVSEWCHITALRSCWRVTRSLDDLYE